MSFNPSLGRLKWAARATWYGRPRTLMARLRLLYADFILHGLFGPGGERCQDCGRSYPLWHAAGDLWEAQVMLWTRRSGTVSRRRLR